ncbi:hypothetical protein NPIL_689511 [Nephila pilipes]|uniref:Uncharacterized protein n=1 Tax=Nephila pilipes TaxID=299642 RepID=A0A8X6IUH6_NEPPI|nr:hypothetical protein NPIL_689511 [Nephila pilipes]
MSAPSRSKPPESKLHKSEGTTNGTYILRSPDELDSTRGLLPSRLNFTLILVMSMLLTATRRKSIFTGEKRATQGSQKKFRPGR